jgi:CubicO group peptidase (beta-lactamase class C family)
MCDIGTKLKIDINTCSHFLALSRGEANIDIIRRMRHLRPAYAFREHWHYNDIVGITYLPIIILPPLHDRRLTVSSSLRLVPQQYMVAQHLVERFSGMPLGDFVTQRIFVPLNMTSSTYSFEYAISTGHLSESYEFGGRRIPHWLEKEDMPVVAGAGGIMSSAVDLLKWGRAMLGVTNTTAVGIPREILERCMSPEATIDASLGRTYGFGWGQGVMMGTKVGTQLHTHAATVGFPDLVSYDSDLLSPSQVVTHSGGLPGVTSLIALLPEHNAVITLQCSAEGKEDANRAVLAELLAAIINSDDDSKDM